MPKSYNLNHDSTLAAGASNSSGCATAPVFAMVRNHSVWDGDWEDNELASVYAVTVCDLMSCKVPLELSNCLLVQGLSPKCGTYQISHSRPLVLGGLELSKDETPAFKFKMSWISWVHARGIWQFTKGKCKDSATNSVRSHHISRNLNPLPSHCKSFKCTRWEDALIVWQF